MRQSLLFTKTQKIQPHDEIAKNAILLLRSGYINKTMAGVYEFLPLGLKALNNIIKIIREEMDKIEAQEILLSGLQNKEVWEKTDRWCGDAEEIWFKSKLNTGSDVGFGWTHEEPITKMMGYHINSYKDLPIYVYQFQTKFRNEKRAKSGILRTREFIMKDLYSFSKNEEDHKIFYEKCAAAYLNIYKRLGIEDITYRTFASGGAFSQFSDEFQVVIPVGEDVIYIDKKKKIALNKEVYTDEVLKKLDLKKEELEEVNASEVGNIFTLGTRFSKSLDLKYKTKEGEEKYVFMGSYGIGPARLLGILVDVFGTENGFVLPADVAPYKIHLLRLGKDEQLIKKADEVYEILLSMGYEVLYDDRENLSNGEKFADADFIGSPYRIFISNKTIENKEIEYKNMLINETKIIKDLKELKI